MKCNKCKKQMQKTKDVIKEDNIEFDIYECKHCGERLMDMKQLHQLANKYRKLKKAQEVKFTKWGNSIAVRISKNFVNDLKIRPGKAALMYKDGQELRILVG
ncbi:hypothetical protein A3K72_03200 [Candidatus Woesearchaeota archaeon RBG_13_36_6]|nr:MAG: hypothetical protein A3K72_03200 [Candidatus Woesearchaeota archaeon RBG_13_36_6]